MASVGFAGALGVEGMNEAIRQRIMDTLNQQQAQHTMGLQDAELKLHQDEAAQNAADRAAALAERTQGLNEKIGQATATNLGPGQTVISPQLASRFANTSLAPLVQPDQTLPSTQMASGAMPPGSQEPSTAPSITPQAPTVTGQLRFMGTPQANKQAADDATLSQMASDPKTAPAIRGFLQMRQALPRGENIPYQLLTEPNGPQKAGEIKETPQGFVRIGADNSVTPIAAQPYHAPVQPVVLQTANGAELVNRGQGTASPITEKATGAAVQAPVSANIQLEQTHKKNALASLDQLDQSVDAAKDMIGPGEGRVSNLEQMIGNADPKIQALGTKMLLAKMQVDAAIGGARAAASPQLLARWDNLLANKVTPEGLKSAIQAMREIIGEGVAVPPSAAPTKVRRFNPATGGLD